MKRGATHADWAVSLGIFLIYVLSLFLLIQPGVEPVFKNENLIKVVEDSFFEDVTREVQKIPIIIIPELIAPLSQEYIVVISGEIPFEGMELVETDFGMFDVEGRILPFQISFNAQNTGIDEIRVQTPLSENPTIIYLYYSINGNYLNSNIDQGLPLIYETNSQTGHITRNFGAKETMTGINQDGEFQSIKAIIIACNTLEGYNNLKAEWNYPLNKDFQIFWIRHSRPQYTQEEMIPICNQAQPYAQTSVFVQDRIEYMIGLSGLMEPARISMRIW